MLTNSYTETFSYKKDEVFVFLLKPNLCRGYSNTTKT